MMPTEPSHNVAARDLAAVAFSRGERWGEESGRESRRGA
jgi:hypothetical protein